MKTCYRCHLEKPVEEFSKNSKRSDGLSAQCKACHKIMRKAHYEANKQSTVDKVSDRKRELRVWLNEIKQNLSCKECGFSHPAALDFHHRNPDDKSAGVPELINRGASKETILVEISKCDVLCANCHRIYHHNERAELV